MNDNLDKITEQLQGIRSDLAECLGKIFPDEETVVPAPSTIRRPPLAAEIDAEIVFSGHTIPVTLRVYGRHIKAMKGGHEPGERPYEPDTPAGFDVWSVELGGEGTDILGDIGQEGEEEIVRYVMERGE